MNKLALPLSLVAVVLAAGMVIHELRQGPTESRSADQRPAEHERIEAIEKRLDGIERALEAWELAAAPLSDVRGSDARIRDEEALAEIATLVSRVDNLETDLETVAVEGFSSARLLGREALDNGVISDLQEILADRNAEDAARLEALATLRIAPRELDPHAAVVKDLIAWLDSAESEDVREDIMRQLHGAEEETLVAPLLHVLQRDASAKVRAKAAETLDDYLDRADVQRALRSARDHDPSEQVRRAAGESLEGGERKGDDDED